MKSYSLSHLSDSTIDLGTPAAIGRERSCTADALAWLAEFDVRKRYLPAAYPSMRAYCEGALGLSDDSACRRITAARLALRFPAIFPAVADGRLHLSGLVMLAPYLTEENAENLLAAAARKSKCDLQRILAERFPRPGTAEGPQSHVSHSQSLAQNLPAPARVDQDSRAGADGLASAEPIASGRLAAGDLPAPVPARGELRRASLTPIGPELYELRATVGSNVHELLRYAQDLLSHQLPSGNLAVVIEKALEALIPQLEKRKFAATPNPRAGRSRSAGSRGVPSHVKRAVWKRDQRQCTFVSESGRRCEERRFLEFDHAIEVARGGESTVANIRLRCRAHNQYAAECAFGPGFMREKRRAAAEARRAEQERRGEVIPWLRSLGIGAAEARRAAEAIGPMPGATLEERVRAALSFHGAASGAGVRAANCRGAMPPSPEPATAPPG